MLIRCVKVRAISLASFELHRAVNDQEQFYKDIGLEEREELEEMEGGAEWLRLHFLLRLVSSVLLLYGALKSSSTQVFCGVCCRACEAFAYWKANDDEKKGAQEA